MSVLSPQAYRTLSSPSPDARLIAIGNLRETEDAQKPKKKRRREKIIIIII
jgi:hypothetical protein